MMDNSFVTFEGRGLKKITLKINLTQVRLMVDVFKSHGCASFMKQLSD